MPLQILGPNHYASSPGDVVTYSATAAGIPFNAVIGSHSSGVNWSGDPASGAVQFTMPAQATRFSVAYGFTPDAPADAHYAVTIRSGDGFDGFPVKQGAFAAVTLAYYFEPQS
jgi:hypothetical protein